MKRLPLLFSLLAVAAAVASAQPVIGFGGIVQAANYSPGSLPGASLAPGAIFSIYGTGFNTALVSATAGQAIPTNLGGTTVNFTVNGTATAALLLFVDGGQINGILPSSVATGTAQVTVSFGGQTSAPQPMPIVASNFASFTLNGAGTGPAAAQNFPSYQVNQLIQTVEPGSGVVILYGTGLGAGAGGLDQTDAGGAAGYGTDLRPVDNLDLHLYIGGVDSTANILYAGRASFAGEDQINFTIPANVPTGCYVPVIVRSGKQVSNSASISINTTGATCSDPMGLTQSQVSQASTGKLNVGALVLTRLALNIGLGVPITQDDAEAHFYGFDGTSYYSNPIYNPDFISISSFGSCAITTCSNTYTCVPSAQGLPATELDAGAALSVSGSNVSATSVPKASNGYAAHLGSNPIPIGSYPSPVDYLNSANSPFSFSGTGGADVGSFAASISVPAPMTLAAKDSAGNTLTTSKGAAATNAVINRANDLTVTWTPGSANAYTLVSVSSAISTQTANSAPYNSVTITCLQPSSAGSATIPSWLLQALPVSSTVTLPGLNIIQDSGAILLGTYNVTNTFSASGLDVALANSIVSSGANFPVQ